MKESKGHIMESIPPTPHLTLSSPSCSRDNQHSQRLWILSETASLHVFFRRRIPFSAETNFLGHFGTSLHGGKRGKYIIPGPYRTAAKSFPRLHRHRHEACRRGHNSHLVCVPCLLSCAAPSDFMGNVTLSPLPDLETEAQRGPETFPSHPASKWQHQDLNPGL